MTTQPPPWEDETERHLPPHHNPLPELVGEHERIPTQEEFERIQASQNFVDLKKRFRAFAFPMTVAFLVWYFAYVLLSTYAPGAMSVRVLGTLNLGLLLGLAQFATTFLITWLYLRHANKSLDPLARAIRAELEGDTK